MKKVYISGPIAHYDIEERQKTFARAADLLRRRRFEPVNPFENGLSQSEDWRQHMKADIKMLLDCDYIYMLPGWEESKGCKLELDVASTCGIPVVYEHHSKLY